MYTIRPDVICFSYCVTFLICVSMALEREPWERFIMRLSDFLFPPRCPICDKVLAVDSNHIPHEKCQKKVFPIVEPYCLKCGKPILHSEYEFAPCVLPLSIILLRDAASFYMKTP